MVTGSLASSLQGEPRATHDIDLVVAIPQTAAAHLASAFPPPNYCLDEISARDAISKRSMFNLIDNRDGQLDLSHIEEWAARLGVQELWERIKREARPPHIAG